jgi:hypothetical protein
MQGMTIRMAKGLNRVMVRKGRVFSDRFHAHVLRTPTEVRHAVRYVSDNAKRHAAQRGETYSAGYVDPYSSTGDPECARAPESWPLCEGWRQARGRP